MVLLKIKKKKSVWLIILIWCFGILVAAYYRYFYHMIFCPFVCMFRRNIRDLIYGLFYFYKYVLYLLCGFTDRNFPTQMRIYIMFIILINIVP